MDKFCLLMAVQALTMWGKMTKENFNQPIAIFAGRGFLPKMLIDDCQKNNRKFQLFLLESEEYEIDYSAFNPIKLPYGAVTKFLEILHEKQIQSLVFIGAVNKPNFSAIKVDKKGAILLTKILASKILGDNAVLRTVINFFEKEGLKILRIDEILSDIVAKKSVLTKTQPNKGDIEDIEIAKKAIHIFSEFDVGQSVIVAQKQILAVEALEGTDEMIKRCSKLKVDYKQNAILVKIKKFRQSSKADLPTIGVETVNNCYQNGIKGIAIQAGATLIIHKDEVIELADKLGIFLIAL
ncbi:MAG TPA: UDP-2,3-diacylglucosamine diphosphatase LpxI [Rickettsiales bacterium]|nr:UDP-2,3-diacylglucosamine diphosphatase LpxI [Rickettsiales bacterium]